MLSVASVRYDRLRTVRLNSTHATSLFFCGNTGSIRDDPY